jgi:phosphoserine phosphatase
LIVAFDLEGTLVDAELFPALGKCIGKKPALEDITNRAMRGELDFTTSLDMRMELVQGMSLDTVRRVSESLSLSKGAKETVYEIKRIGGIPIIITGGFDILANRVARLLGIEYVCCNRFKIEENCVTGIMEPMVTGKGKAEKLLGLTSWLGIKPSNCVAVGDGANDIDMMKATGLSIAFNGRRRVCDAATVSIKERDLRLILSYIEKFADRGNAKRKALVTQS